ncbi:cysteine proteinase, partial [Stereum hirsutum FP-91666 SS1]|uniref:cysteine proteinase n=1 Tax=Stereum hirsutum (strain FP-91666) TaxID=721885 RepID=UPI0004449F7F
YTKATQAELNGDFDAAFRLYLDSAKAFLHLSRTNGGGGVDEKTKNAWKIEAAKALERAEKIKKVKKDAVKPVVRDAFAEQEQFLVLKKGSVVNGLSVPFWSDGVPENEPRLLDPEGQLQLSTEQKAASVEWRRPSQLPNTEIDVQSGSQSSLRLPDSKTIRQRTVADCSLCASIVVCLQHHERHGSTVGRNIFRAKSVISKQGKYELRTLFNGAYRRVTIDDNLPFHPNGQLLCMSLISTRHTGPLDMWPSLVEKAYLKLMGGYDFHGSNSSTDIHCLNGWIPEHIEMKSSRFQREQTWTRLLQGFSNGTCVLTVGTGDKPRQDWYGSEYSLLAAHSYAVVELEDGTPWVTVLDSWVSQDAALHELEAGQGEEELVFAWDDLCNVFDSLYVNWDPKIFYHQTNHHALWRSSHLSDVDKDDSSHQTVRIHIDGPPKSQDGPAEVWFLLTRHRTDTRRTSEYISLHIEVDDVQSSSSLQHLPVQGNYTNSPHVLVRKCIGSSSFMSSRPITFSITTSYEGPSPSSNVGFTITVYSTTPASWDHTLLKLPYEVKASGILTSKTSGGNYNLPTYMINPQWRLQITPPTTSISNTSRSSLSGPSKARVSIVARTEKDVPINVMVVWGQGNRVFDVVQNEVAANSGAYNYGYAHVEKELLVGDYTLILSAFEPTHQGPFSLRLESSHRVKIEPIPQEGAGMFSKVIRGEWASTTAAGSHNFGRYGSNPMYELTLSAPSQIRARLQLFTSTSTSTSSTSTTSPTTSLNISIFPSPFPNVTSAPLLTSGPYSDALSGVSTPLVSLKTGTYVLVPSTYDPGVEGGFRMVVYSSAVGVGVSGPL